MSARNSMRRSRIQLHRARTKYRYPAAPAGSNPSPNVVDISVSILAPGISTAVTTTTVVVAASVPSATVTTLTGKYVTSISSNGRYLLDQDGNPIFIQGNSPQNMTGQYTPTQVHNFFVDQAARGINAAQIHSMVNENIGANSGSVNYNGDPPWTSMSTFSGTSAATDRYWANVDNIFDEAEAVGCTIFFNPVDNISYAGTMGSISDTNASNYGAFLGNRYKNRPGLVWMFGNDYQSGQWSASQAKYAKVYDGIRSTGDTHLVTLWLNYTDSISTDIVDSGGFTGWDSRIQIQAVYSYTLPYYGSERAYGRSAGSGNPRPVLGFEWNYENEHLHPEFGQGNTTRLTLRRSAWWSVTWGSMGTFFGQHGVWGGTLDLGSGNLGSSAAQDNAIIADVMAAYPNWYKMVPDTGSTFVTSNRGTHSTSESVDPLDNNYVTAAVAPDGSLGMVYFSNWSSSGTASIDVAGKIAGTPTITRIDPTNGATTSDSAPFSNPGNNAAGDPDWLLVFEGSFSPGLIARRTKYNRMAALGRKR